ncbi:MAG: glycosyltransferase family 4 protein [Gammaproteobacteria bacterium]|nr:glycosyltransferase family 4 protein [Gammaproteobacteria bacterium]
MNVLVVGQNYRIVGGSDRYLVELCELLKKNGHNPIPFVAEHEQNLKTKYEKYFPKRVNFENPRIRDVVNYCYSFSARTSINRLLRDEKIDIVHLNIYYGQLTSSIIREVKSRKIPIVQTLHEYKLLCPVYRLYRNESYCDKCITGNYFYCLYHRCNRGSVVRSLLSVVESMISRYLGSNTGIDRFIAISKYVKMKHVEAGIEAERITVVPNFTSSLGRQERRKSDYFLFFGRVEREKGTSEILDLARESRYRILVVGEGSEKKKMEEVKQKEVLDNLEIVGFKSGNDLDELIRNAKASIILSRWEEPFGLSVVESMARGTIPIASKRGGITEIVADGEDGFLVDGRNSKEILEKMTWVVNNQSEVEVMEKKAIEKVEQNYSEEVFYRKLMGVYRKEIFENV